MSTTLEEVKGLVKDYFREFPEDVDEAKKSLESLLPSLIEGAGKYAQGTSYPVATTPNTISDCLKLMDSANFFYMMEGMLNVVEKVASYLKKDVSVQVNAIKGIGYESAIPTLLKLAGGQAETENEVNLVSGANIIDMDGTLEAAERAATFLKKDISAQVDTIRRAGYERAIPELLRQARAYAQMEAQPDKVGGPVDARSSLEVAQKAAKYLGRDISAEVTEIRALSEK